MHEMPIILSIKDETEKVDSKCHIFSVFIQKNYNFDNFSPFHEVFSRIFLYPKLNRPELHRC